MCFVLFIRGAVKLEQFFFFTNNWPLCNRYCFRMNGMNVVALMVSKSIGFGWKQIKFNRYFEKKLMLFSLAYVHFLAFYFHSLIHFIRTLSLSLYRCLLSLHNESLPFDSHDDNCCCACCVHYYSNHNKAFTCAHIHTQTRFAREDKSQLKRHLTTSRQMITTLRKLFRRMWTGW